MNMSAVHMFGYSAESLLNDQMQQFQKDLEAQSKLSNLRIDKLEEYINESNDLDNLEEIKFKDGETHVLVNAKLFKDINKQLEDLKINQKYLEQDSKNKLQEQRKEIILEATNIIEERSRVERNKFEKQLITELSTCKTEAIKDTIQILYNKGLFDSYENKDQILQNYLSFSDEYLLKKYGKEIKIGEDIYYLSDLDYNIRDTIISKLKDNNYTDIVDLKHRMKLTDTEINFILFD